MFTKLFISLFSLVKFTKIIIIQIQSNAFLIFEHFIKVIISKLFHIVLTISKSQKFLLFLIEKRESTILWRMFNLQFHYHDRSVTSVVTISSTNFCYSSSCCNLYRWYFVTIPRPTLYHYSDCFERFVDSDRKSNILNGKSNARGWTTKDLVYFESIDSWILMVVFFSRVPENHFNCDEIYNNNGQKYTWLHTSYIRKKKIVHLISKMNV